VTAESRSSLSSFSVALHLHWRVRPPCRRPPPPPCRASAAARSCTRGATPAAKTVGVVLREGALARAASCVCKNQTRIPRHQRQRRNKTFGLSLWTHAEQPRVTHEGDLVCVCHPPSCLTPCPWSSSSSKRTSPQHRLPVTLPPPPPQPESTCPLACVSSVEREREARAKRGTPVALHLKKKAVSCTSPSRARARTANLLPPTTPTPCYSL
jgi:hypothetical protein